MSTATPISPRDTINRASPGLVISARMAASSTPSRGWKNKAVAVLLLLQLAPAALALAHARLADIVSAVAAPPLRGE